jgi:hypothetical protein
MVLSWSDEMLFGYLQTDVLPRKLKRLSENEE